MIKEPETKATELESLKVTKKNRKLGRYATLGIIMLLLVFSVAQTVQLSELKEDFDEIVVTQASGTSTSSTSASVPSRSQMVGGC